MEKDAETELEKNNRQRSLLFKVRDSRRKNASLHTGDQTRNNMSHNMSHNMSQPTMNNTWTFRSILLVLPIIELSWNHCLFSIMWSVSFVLVILVTAVNLWDCCDLDMFYSELVVSWKKTLYSLTFNSLWWPRQNFSLHYQYNIKQTSDENKKISIRGWLVDPVPNSLN